MYRLTIPALLALCISACVTPRFNPAVADQLQPGVSTTADAERLLGRPSARSAAANNGTLLQWVDIQGSPVGGYGAHVAILFDQAGKMVRVMHRFQTP